MRPLTTTRALGLLAAGAMFIAACGGNAPTTAPTQAAATTAPTTAPVATDGAAASPAASFAMPSFHGDVDLESVIPKVIGGQTLTVLSMTGDQFLGAGTASPELVAALQALNKAPKDLSVAFAGAANITIVAFRVEGVAADTLFNAFKDAQTEALTSETVTYGGKTVTKLTPTEGPLAFIYIKDDTMFLVGGQGAIVPSDDLLNEAFSKLP